MDFIHKQTIFKFSADEWSPSDLSNHFFHFLILRIRVRRTPWTWLFFFSSNFSFAHSLAQCTHRDEAEIKGTQAHTVESVKKGKIKRKPKKIFHRRGRSMAFKGAANPRNATRIGENHAIRCGPHIFSLSNTRLVDYRTFSARAWNAHPQEAKKRTTKPRQIFTKHCTGARCMHLNASRRMSWVRAQFVRVFCPLEIRHWTAITPVNRAHKQKFEMDW